MRLQLYAKVKKMHRKYLKLSSIAMHQKHLRLLAMETLKSIYDMNLLKMEQTKTRNKKIKASWYFNCLRKEISIVLSK